MSVRSLSTATSRVAGRLAVQLRQQLLDAVDDLDDVGAGLALDVQDDRRRLVGPGQRAGVFSAPSTTSATSLRRIGAPLR